MNKDVPSGLENREDREGAAASGIRVHAIAGAGHEPGAVPRGLPPLMVSPGARPSWRTEPLWVASLACLVLVFVLVNARWIWLFRLGQPLDIDESAYLSIAVTDYYGLQAGGLLGWLRVLEAPSVPAPLTTALASLVYGLVGPHVAAAFVVTVAAGAATILATYFLARRFASPAAALAASALVASCPIVVNFSRSFDFAMPATAVMTIGLLSLVRSEGFSRLRWACAFGICLGLLPLARTMTIAFVPGLVLAAVIAAIAAERRRARRLAVLCGALLLAGATAGSWLVPNGRYVFHYLFSFGYGARATEFGPGLSFFSLDAWYYTARGLIISYIYLPHAFVLLAGLVGLPFLLALEVKRRGRAMALRAAWRSPALPVAICIAEVLAALTSSQNKGSAFIAPIVPAMLVLAVWIITRLSAWRGGRRLIGTGCVAICVFAAVPLIDLSWATARPRIVVLPGRDSFVLADGRGTMQLYERAAGFGTADAVQMLTPAEGRAWNGLTATTAATLRRVGAETATVAFGFRHVLYNVNSIRLQMLLAGRAVPAGLVQVEPVVTGDTVPGYVAWLTTGEAAQACFLLTLSGEGGVFPPPVSNDTIVEAARQAGFLPLRDWPTPDRRTVTLFGRRDGHPPCPPT